MNDRRRFLHVLGASTAAMALPACGGDASGTGGGGGNAATGAGGAGGGGAGGAGGSGSTSTASSTSTSNSTSTATSSSTGGGNCEANPPGTAVGTPADYTTDGLHLVAGTTKILVGKDAGGFYALTSVCPHQLCDMDGKIQGQAEGTILASGGIVCNCHGSRFDAVGNLTKGPATKGLKAYQMHLGCDGKLYADKTKTVSNTERLKVS